MNLLKVDPQRRKKKKKRKTKVVTDENVNPEKASLQARQSQYSVNDLIELAEGYLDSFEYESAQHVIHRALEIDADNPRVLELASSLLIENGNKEAALQCLGRAITVAPSQGYSKFFSIAQLLEGREALQMYLQGIELLVKELESTSEEQVAAACAPAEGEEKRRSKLQKELSTAYISISEMYMTDLCDDDDAETQCERAISNAKEADPTNPEALQQQANFLLIKGEMEGAKSAMQESVSKWLPQLRAAADWKGEGEVEDLVELCPFSVPSRLTAAKNFIELEEWDLSAEILDLIIHEDEDITEPWYLQGWLNYLRGDDFKGNARFYLKKALEIASKTDFDDEEVLTHIKQLQEELGEGMDSEDEIDENIDSEASSSEDEEQ